MSAYPLCTGTRRHGKSTATTQAQSASSRRLLCEQVTPRSRVVRVAQYAYMYPEVVHPVARLQPHSRLALAGAPRSPPGSTCNEHETSDVFHTTHVKGAILYRPGVKGDFLHPKFLRQMSRKKFMHMCICLRPKEDADAIHHGGLTGCDADPGPQGIGIIRNIMSIGNICVYSVSLVAILLCILHSQCAVCMYIRVRVVQTGTVQGALTIQCQQQALHAT